MSGEVHRLWKLEELEQFRVQHEGLEPHELHLVKQTLRELRRSFELPGDMDVDVMPPDPPGRIYWRRHVDQTDLWVFYDVIEPGTVQLLSVRPFDDW